MPIFTFTDDLTDQIAVNPDGLLQELLAQWDKNEFEQGRLPNFVRVVDREIRMVGDNNAMTARFDKWLRLAAPYCFWSGEPGNVNHEWLDRNCHGIWFATTYNVRVSSDRDAAIMRIVFPDTYQGINADML